MTWTLGIALVAGGYVAAIFTWPKIRELINGARVEADALYQRARDLERRIKG